MRMPGVEPGMSPSQGEVLTTILHTPGEAGYRSQYLSHAKRALYHLSYIPIANHKPPLFHPQARTVAASHPSIGSGVVLAPHSHNLAALAPNLTSKRPFCCPHHITPQYSQYVFLITHTNSHRVLWTMCFNDKHVVVLAVHCGLMVESSSVIQ